MEPINVSQIQESLPALRREYQAAVRELAEAARADSPVGADALDELVRQRAAVSPWVVEAHRAAVVVLVSSSSKTVPVEVVGPLPKILELAAFEALSADAFDLAQVLETKERGIAL